MYFRFLVALILLAAIAIVSIGIQKRNLELKRRISLEQYQLELLREQEARMRLEVERLESPEQLNKVQAAERSTSQKRK